MTYFVGLDVSVKETSVCVVDAAGAVILEQKVPTEPADIIALLTSLGVTFGRIGIEAGPLSQWLVNALTAVDLPVICVETRHMQALLTAQQISKTDRKDARDRADDAGRPVQAGACEDAGCPGTADAADQPQAASAQAARRGVRIARHAAQFRSESGRRQQLSIRNAGPRARRRISEAGRDRRAAAQCRRVMRQQLAVLHKMLLDTVRGDPVCRRLMTAPGVGAVVALTYRATVDQPQRFVHSRAVGAHVGLTPKRYQSGETDYEGGVSKCGDALLRTMLYEAAHALLIQSRKWSWLRAWGIRVAQRRGVRRAIVAVARRLAVVLHRMWVDGSEFRWSKDSAAVPAVA